MASLRKIACAAALVFAWCNPPAFANPVVFDFTGTVNGKSAKNNVTLPVAGDDSSNSWVTPYMNQVLRAAAPDANWGVAVSGAETSGRAWNGVPENQIKDSGYTSNRHVSCVTGSGPTCISDTLAAKDNMPFLMTSGAVADGNGDAEIKMEFSGGLEITRLSFDFEIFPNGSCPQLKTGFCGDVVDGVPSNIPDFTFLMTSGGVVLENRYVTAVAPGTAAMTTTSMDAYAVYTLERDALNSFSALGAERAPQYIGTMTFDFYAPIMNPTFEFIDWPEAIGVTNIRVEATPEPGAVMLLGFGLLGLSLIRRRSLL